MATQLPTNSRVIKYLFTVIPQQISFSSRNSCCPRWAELPQRRKPLDGRFSEASSQGPPHRLRLYSSAVRRRSRADVSCRWGPFAPLTPDVRVLSGSGDGV